MSDIFAPFVPEEYLAAIIGTIVMAERSTFWITTKRPECMLASLNDGRRLGDLVAAAIRRHTAITEGVARILFTHVVPNPTLATSIEHDWFVSRANALRATPAARRVVIAEPLLGPLPSLVFAGFDAISVGGESGGRPERALVRPCTYPDHAWLTWDVRCHVTGWEPKPTALAWVLDLRDRACASGVEFSFHQWGGPTSWTGGAWLPS